MTTFLAWLGGIVGALVLAALGCAAVLYWIAENMKD